MDRRKFLQSSAAAGAGLVFAPTAFGQTSDNENGKGEDDIYVALLGAGAQGQILMSSLLRMGQTSGIKVRAVCDIWEAYNLRRVSRTLDAYSRFGHKGTAYIDYREMLDKEKDLDAVIICTPEFWHAEHTVACLEAGLDVYCEKEMSDTIEGARKMVEAARRTGKLLQIGHQRRSNPRYIYCYDKIIHEANLLNRITTINGQWNRGKAACEDLGWPDGTEIDKEILREYGYESMHQFRNWRWFKGLGGGPIVDLGSHQIDIYNWFLDARPKAVMASGGIDYWKDHEWYDNVMAVYEYETAQGAVRAFYQTITTNSSNGYYEHFMGDEGTLVVTEGAGLTKVYREGHVPERQWERWVREGIVKIVQDVTQEEQDAVADVRATVPAAEYELPVVMDVAFHLPHLENFFAAMRGQEELTCPHDKGYETAVTILKVNEAVEAGKELKFSDDEFEV